VSRVVDSETTVIHHCLKWQENSSYNSGLN